MENGRTLTCSAQHKLQPFAFTLAVLTLLIALIFTAPAQAVVIFQDNFDDGNADGWTFHRNDSTEWGVLGGALSSSVGDNDRHDPTTSTNGSPGWAIIDGVTTPDHFRLDADISVVRYQDTNTGVVDTDHGHVGFGWGIQSPDSATSDHNQHYLRTHFDHVTTWSTSGGFFTPPELTYSVGSTINGAVYHLSLEVDFLGKLLTSSFTNGATTTTQIYSGSTFDSIVRHSGGSIGLVNWGEEVSYDNVVLQSFDVPEPSAWVLLLTGLLAFRSRSRKSS